MTLTTKVPLTDLSSLIMRTYIKKDETGAEIGEVLPSGWSDLNFVADYQYKDWLEPLSMRVGVFLKNGRYVIAFDGMQPDDIQDVVAMVGTYVGTGSAQYAFAIDFVRSVIETYGISVDNLLITGHSQGGAMAQLAGAYFGADAITLNAIAIANTSILSTDKELYLYDIGSAGNFRASYSEDPSHPNDLIDVISIPASPNVSTSKIQNFYFPDDMAHSYLPNWANFLGSEHPIEIGEGGTEVGRHTISFTRFCTYFGLERMEAWSEIFPEFYEPFMDSSNFSEGGHMQAGAGAGSMEVFLAKIVDQFIQGNDTPLNNLIGDSEKIVAAYQQGLVDQYGGWALIRLSLQLAENAIEGNPSIPKVQLYSEQNNAFIANLATLPIHSLDGIDEGQLPGATYLTYLALSLWGQALSSLQGDAGAAVSDAYNRTIVLKEGRFSGIAVAGDQSGMIDVVAPVQQGNYGALFFGASGADVAVGSDKQDVFFGGDGQNRFDGGAEADLLIGGQDNDELIGGEGNDIITDFGGDGNKLSGNAGDDVIVGGTGKDELDGGKDNDKLWGGGGEDKIFGGANNDELHGGEEKDELYGGADNDQLFGDGGKDTLDGGGGEDELTGGDGADTFIVGDGDHIKDPEKGDRAKYNGTTFVHGKKANDSDSFYTGDSGEKYYAQDDSLKIVTSDGATIYVEDWEDGDLGIKLVDDPGDDNGEEFQSPLVIDLNGNGIEVTQLKGSTAFFDLDNDGFAEQTAWVSGGDGLLALDRNGNGTIDSQSELFGAGIEATRDESRGQWDSGFEALSDLDANRDGKIDASDAKFTDLKVWLDANGDGKSQADELRSLTEVGIKSISVTAQHVSQTINGNPVTDIGSFERADGSLGTVADVWFNFDPTTTRHDAQQIIDPATDSLPNLAGRGELDDLNIAMSADPLLREMVAELAASTVADLPKLSSQVEAILLRWAKADTVDPTSRGDSIDARILVATEKINGLPWLRRGDTSSAADSPRQIASSYILEDWRDFTGKAAARLLAQIPVGQQVLPGLQDFGLAFLSFDPPMSLDATLASIAARSPGDEQAKIQYWHSMVLVLEALQSNFAEVGTAMRAKLDQALALDGLAFDSGTIRNAIVGDDEANYLKGRDWNYGGGDDVWSHDGKEGADLIVGGAGNDSMNGGVGDDVYWIARDAGADVIWDSDGFNSIRFAAGIAASDVTFTQQADGVLVQIAGSSGTILIKAGSTIRELEFADGAKVDTGGNLLNLGYSHVYGTSSDDVLTGTGGDESLEGGKGSDAYVFDIGSGQDKIVELAQDGSADAGTSVLDEVRFGPGVTSSNIAISRGGLGDLDLYIGVSGRADQLRIMHQFGDSPQRVERFVFSDGTIWTDTDIDTMLAAATTADDRLLGGGGSDLLDGGAGRDTLIGGRGTDIYRFGIGYGQDRIVDVEGASTLQLGDGIDADDLVVSRGGSGLNDLIIQIKGTTDVLTVSQQFKTGTGALESVIFKDGTVWNKAGLLAHIAPASGTPQADLLLGDTGDDRLDGVAGDDLLNGAEGNDTYVFGRGYGQDRITNEYGDFGALDTVEFSAGVSPADLKLSLDGSWLRIEILGTQDSLTIEDQIITESVENGIERFVFADGTVWTKVDLYDRLRQGSSGNDNIYDLSDGAVELDAGSGNDTIRTYGLSTISFGHGDGQDEVVGSDNVVIRFKADVSLSDLEFARPIVTGWDGEPSAGQELIVRIRGSEDKLTIPTFTDSTVLKLNDGTVLSHADIRAATIASAQSAGDDIVIGYGEADVLDGGAGNDYLRGFGGGDTYKFGIGYGSDRIESAYGNDTLEFGPSITPGDVTATFVDYSVVLSIAGTPDQVTISNQLTPYYNSSTNTYTYPFGIGTYRFADGTVWSANDLRQILTNPSGGSHLVLGDAAANALHGGTGNDVLYGLAGSDTYLFNLGDGVDTIRETDDGSPTAIDLIKFGAGITRDNIVVHRAENGHGFDIDVGTNGDKVKIAWGSISWGTIEGIEFSDGSQLDRTQIGQRAIDNQSSAGAETIWGYEFAERLDGGAGNDVLRGDQGVDTYVFGRGYGQDLVIDTTQNNLVELKSGISADDLTVRWVRNNTDYDPYSHADLQILVKGTSDVLTIKDQWPRFGSSVISQIQFSNGDVWTASDIEARALGAKSVGDDLLLGREGYQNDVLDGGAGQDRLEGWLGDDTYVFGRGYGSDTVVDIVPRYWTAGYDTSVDTVQFLSDVAPTDVSFSRGTDNFNDLVIRISGTTDVLTIHEQFFGADPVIEKFRFSDGTDFTAAQVLQSLSTATAGDDVLVDRLVHDATLNGGAGNDTLIGQDGSDTYVFGRGSGVDVIVDDSSVGDSLVSGAEQPVQGSTDIVSFAADIAPEDLVLSRAGESFEDLVIRIAGTNDCLIIKGGALGASADELENGSAIGVEEYHFADGTVWTRNYIAGLDLSVDRAGNNIIFEESGAALDGGSGNDQLFGGASDSIYVFNRGYGSDVISDGGGTLDAVQFGPNIPKELLVFRRSGENGKDLLIEVDGLEELTLSIQDQFLGENNRVEEFHFANGDVLSWVEVQAIMLGAASTDSDDNIVGFAGNDRIEGAKGNDVLAGGAGNDQLDGGIGFDKAIYSGKSSDYEVSTVNGITIIRDLKTADGNDGFDTLRNLEQVQFLGDNVGIQISAGNSAPLSAADSFGTTEDVVLVMSKASLIANDSDADGDELIIKAVSNVTGGTAWVNLAGGITFRPEANFHGPASFSYSISDGQGGVSTAIVDVLVAAANDAPLASAINYQVTEDTALAVPVTSGLLSGATDVDGDTLTATLVSNPAHGLITLNANGSFVYVPHGNYSGSDSFTYSVGDGMGGTSVSQVTLTIQSANDAPIAVDDSGFETVGNQSLVIPIAGLLANDSDIDGDALSLESIDGMIGGSVFLQGGDLVFVPTANFVGTAEFTYTVSDGRGSTAEATVHIAVSAPGNANEAPGLLVDADAASNVVREGAANGTSVGITVHATDPDAGDTLTYSLSDNAGGRFQINATTGVVAVANGALLNYANATSHKITVVATDTGGLSQAQDLMIQVESLSPIGQPEQIVATFSGAQLAGATTLSSDDHLFTWIEGAVAKGRIVGINGQAPSGVLSLGDANGKLGVAAFKGGGFVTASIYGGTLTIRRYDQAGAYLSGSEQQIPGVSPYAGAGASNGLGGYNYRASVATNADGSFIVTWNSSGVDGVGDGIRAQRFNSQGQPDGAVFQVNTITADYQILPIATVLANGTVLIAWQSGAVASQYDVKGQLYAANGQALGAEFSLSSVAGANEGTVSISAMSNGGFVATWFALESQNGSAQDVYARVFDAAGTPVGAAFKVNTNTGDYQWNPVVTVLADDSFVVTWDTARSDIYYDIAGQHFDKYGNPLGTEFTVNTYTTGGQRFSSITADADGGFTVAWQSADGTIRSRSFDYASTNHAPGSLTDANIAINAVAENAADGAAVGVTALASDPDAGDTLTYSLSDDAGGRFQIDAVTGVVTVANGALLDYETATSHSITVVATDAGGLTRSETFSVAVTNVNEAPSTLVDIDATANSVAENAANGTVVGVTALASDPDAGDTLTYSLSDDAGGRFQIDAATGVVMVATSSLLDYETATSHSITVVATDAGGLSKSETFNIAVSNVNEAPTAISLSNGYVIENIAGAEIGTLTVSDPDVGDSHSLSISDNRFEIVGGKLKLKAGISLDFEAEPSVAVTVTATDSGALSKSQSFTINVVNATEQSGPGPDVTVASGGSRSSVTLLTDGRQLVTWLTSGGAKGRYYNMAGVALGAEFSLGTAIGFSAVASQPGGGFVTAQVGTSGQLRVQRYDSSNQPIGTAWTLSASVVSSTYGYAIYQDRVSVTSYPDGSYIVVWGASGADASGSGIAGQRFDSSGAPVGAVFPINSLTSGNQSLSDVIALAGGGFVTVWSDYGTNSGDVRGQVYDALGQQIGTSSFLINTTAGADQFAPALAATSDGGFVAVWNSYGQDAPGDWGVYGQRFDSTGQKVGSEFLINTTISSNQYHVQTAGLADGGFAVVWYSTTGTGVYGQRYNAAGQKVGAEFSIDTPGAGGSEPFVAALPGGGFAVTWTGAGNVVHMRIFGVSNVNVSPFDLVDTDMAANVVLEEGAVNVAVGITAHATEVDLGDTLTYSLLDDAGGRFKINATTGIVTVANSGLIDFETATSHNITVKATDSSGLFVSRVFAIQVQDGNDAPTAISLSSATVAENDAGAVIGTLTVTDPNVGDVHTFNVSDNRFEVVGGQLKLKAGVSLDCEAAASVNVTVIATDLGGLARSQAFVISVSNVNEAPTAVTLSKLTVSEQTQGAEVGTLSVADPDTGDTHSFAVSDNRFEVVNGKLKLKAGVSLDLATETTVTITVTATDTGGLSLSEAFNLEVEPFSSVVTTNGAQRPTAVTSSVSGSNSSVITLSDGRQLVAWNVSGNAKGRFLTASGQVMGAEFALGAAPGNVVSTSALGGGGFVIARQTSSGIAVQRYDATGAALGTAWTTGNGNPPMVTTLSDGGYVVTWHATGIDPDGYGIGGQRFAADGTLVGSVFRINTASVNHQHQPDIVALAGGGFMVAWTDGSAGQYDVRGQLYDAAGNQVGGGDFLINSGRSDAQQLPSVAALSDGGFVVIWESASGQDGDAYGIYGRRYTAQGVAVGTEFLVNTTTAGNQEKPQVTGLTDGGYVVVWRSVNAINGQRYDATGAKVGGEFLVDAAGATANITALPNGGFTVSYTGSSGVITTRTYSDAAILAGDDGDNILTGSSANQYLSGAGGNDTLEGFAGNDLLIGGAGNDTLVGGDGADRYQVGRGTGQDLIQSLDTDGGADALLISASVANDQLWFSRNGDDLMVSVVGTDDRATIQGWYTGTDYKLDQVQLADGRYATAVDVEQLVMAMASFTPPPVGQINLDNTTRQALAPVLAASWH
ncbi:calcium-binding protein [Dongia sp.]|uniref:calcium-binding protein n=1 Tax=Dongia sp. TaxID=1977262 RepID=UPI0035AF1D84